MADKNKLSDFKTQKQNANKHTEYGGAVLERTIQKDGWITAITSAADGEVFDGSERLEKAEILFPDVEPIVIESDGTLPVIVKRTDIPNAEDPRAVRLGLGANRIQELNYDLDTDVLADILAEDDTMLDGFWNETELIDMGLIEEKSKDAEPQTDRAAELQEIWGVELGDLWAIGEHRIICGDCTDAAVVARLMGGERADMVFTDPPYNVGKDYGEKTDDQKTASDYKKWSTAWFSVCKKFSSRIAFTPGTVNVWMWAEIEKPKWMGVWVKKNQVSRNKAGGFNAYEPVLCYGDIKISYDVWDIPVKHDQTDRAHPVPKTIEAWQQILKDLLHDGEIIIDPFSGSGTTMLASQNLSRRCYAAEILRRNIAPSHCSGWPMRSQNYSLKELTHKN